jgi:histidine kinase
VLRARRADGATVLLKTPAEDVPTARVLGRYRHEHRLLHELDGNGAVRTLGLLEHGGRPLLVLEDLGSVSIATLLEGDPLPVGRALDLAVGLASALDLLHVRGVIHKDVKPANAIVSPGTGSVVWIDLGLASRLGLERVAVLPTPIDGTLLYMSPEQTGRTSRGVDHRSDLYSLGATLWHLFVGRTPFPDGPPAALVHAHLARTPPLASEARADVPAAVSALLACLLAKDPGERYQSARGVAADLARLRDRHARGDEAPFALRGADRPLRFVLSDQLYGREGEVAALEAALDEAARGEARVVLVAGPAGIGKSALVQHLKASAVARGGSMLAGKHEALRRDEPYLALREALRPRLRLAFTAPEAALDRWRAGLRDALGESADALVELLPELRRLLPDVVVGGLAPERARDRTRVAFSRLLGHLLDDARPLVMFLDDLQWADSASLDMLQYLTADPGLRGVLWIWSARSEELPLHHGLHAVLEGVDAHGILRRVEPAALRADDVAALLADACGRGADDVAPLARVVVQKTAGNPFFVRSLVLHLVREGVVRPDADRWVWDLDAVGRYDATENVVKLMTEALGRLDEVQRGALRAAACVGRRFEVATLAAALGRRSDELARALWPAVEQGLLAPEGGDYQLAEVGVGDAAYRFVHDRVLEAVHAGLPADERATTHAALGRAMLATSSSGDDVVELFALVEHLRHATALLDAAERRRLAQLAHAAARRAFRSGAFDVAHEVSEAGLLALGDARWTTDADLTRGLAEASATAALHAHRRDVMERRIDEILAHTGEIGAQVGAWVVRLRARMIDLRFEEALTINDQFHERLGIRPPRSADPLVIGRELERVREALGADPVARIASLPVSDDGSLDSYFEARSALAAAHISLRGAEAPAEILFDTRLVLERGLTGGGVWALVVYAFLLSTAFGDVEGGRALAEAALPLTLSLGRPDLRPRCEYMCEMYLRARFESPRARAAPMRRVADRCIEVGDREFYPQALAASAMMNLVGGEALEVIALDASRSLDVLERHGLSVSAEMLRLIDATIASLRAPQPPAGARVLAPLPEGTPTLIGNAAMVMELLLATLFGRLDRAAELALAPLNPTLLGAGVPLPIFWTCLGVALLRAAALGTVSPEQWRAPVERALDELAAFARHCPEAHAYRVAWIEALRAGLDEHAPAPLEALDRVIDAAAAIGCRHDAALAAECAGEVCARRGRQRLARWYARDATARYAQWGATAKVAQLAAAGDLAAGSTSDGSSTRSSSDAVDLDTLLQASKALQREVGLDAVVKRLLALSLENAGAERGALLLRDHDAWHLTASAALDGAGETGARVDLDHIDILPGAVLRFCARSQAAVVLDDARADERYRGDAYVTRTQARSVLCVPLVDKGEITGLLYLENNQAAGAFSPARVELLTTLSSQMALSVVNARHHEELLALHRAANRTLEAKVEERTRDLSAALEDLRIAQEQMIQSEKLAALGQLVGSIAHEINTPMGAIRASVTNLDTSVRSALRAWPGVLQQLGAERVGDFVALLDRGLEPHRPLSTREERGVRRGLAASLEAERIPTPNASADLLASMGIVDRIEPFLPLLRAPGGPRALALAHEVSQQSRSCSTILTAVERVSKVVFALNTYASQDRSGQRVQASLIEGLEVVLTLYGSLIKQGVDVVREYDADPQISCFPDELVQVWTNLIHNALQAMTLKGQLRIQVRCTGDHALVQITDSGSGIEESLQGRVFEPFFTTKPLGEGSGLGLHIVRAIVERHGGDISFESRRGETTFTVSLPSVSGEGPEAR